MLPLGGDLIMRLQSQARRTDVPIFARPTNCNTSRWMAFILFHAFVAATMPSKVDLTKFYVHFFIANANNKYMQFTGEQEVLVHQHAI